MAMGTLKLIPTPDFRTPPGEKEHGKNKEKQSVARRQEVGGGDAFISGGWKCAIVGVPGRGSVSAGLAWGDLLVEHISGKSAEKAEPSETPWHTYDGTPMMAHLQLPGFIGAAGHSKAAADCDHPGSRTALALAQSDIPVRAKKTCFLYADICPAIP